MSVLVAVGITAAPVSGTPIGTGFQYQATLSDAGGPINGVCDLRVRLYDAAVGGVVVGGPLLVEDVAVVDGQAIVELDFGAVFDGGPRWLAVELRDGASSGAFTALSPRQRIRATPIVAHAAHAESAAVVSSAPTAGDADTLDGQHGAYYREWDNLTGVPAGLDDGDDDTLDELACVAGEIPVWGSSGWECGQESGRGYAATTVVGPVGDSIENGAALLAAMAAIGEPASEDEAHLLLIEPGLFDLNGGTLAGKRWVDIAGAGRNATVVTSSICAETLLSDTATITMEGGHAELRDLTVINTCDDVGENGMAVGLNGASFTLMVTRVDAAADVGPSADRAYGVYGLTSNLVLTDVRADAGGAAHSNTAFRVYDDNNRLIDCIGTATGGDFTNGLFIVAHPDPGDYEASVRRGSFKATGPGQTTGIVVATKTGSVELERIEASGGVALMLAGSTGDKVIRVSQLTAAGAVGIDQVSGTMAVTIDHSRVVATGPTISVMAGITTRIAATQLWGAPVGGSPTCAGVWDENWVFYTNTCP